MKPPQDKARKNGHNYGSTDVEHGKRTQSETPLLRDGNKLRGRSLSPTNTFQPIPVDTSAAAVEQRKTHFVLPPQEMKLARHGSYFNEKKLKDAPTSTTTTNSTPHGNKSNSSLFYYIVYAIVNIVISVPGLYGYAAVIFNNPVFAPKMNALSKLVIFSSCIHQLGFTLFSSLPFAIGTVQDAGLIFLSAMSNIIANEMIKDGASEEEIVSTALVILPLGTACLGLVLIVMGKFRLADAVSYLPMPVVGGYLAFIGYFCLLAGVALCISQTMMELKDWAYLLEWDNMVLAFPGLAAGAALTLVSRKAKSPLTLPIAMIAIPLVFYAYIFGMGIGIEGAREGRWVGEVAPPVPISDLFKLVDFKLVRWSMATQCFATWCGMVFVVSFASCLDVAAISMDMGEALDTNRELATVGIANVMSGLTCGFTGSYIFSQTIFTYRTGCHSKWVGVFIMFSFVGVVASTVNVLQVAPLFFLGSTLIFIGWDLLYEWLFEVRHKLIWSEYCVLLATFVAIHIIGINGGIVLGVIIAVIDYVVATAQVSSMTRVNKRSRAVWKPEDWKLLQKHVYHPQKPKIVTVEVNGSVFFGSSLQLLSNILDEAAINTAEDDTLDMDLQVSPHSSQFKVSKKEVGIPLTPRMRKMGDTNTPLITPRPDFIVLDLSQTSNLDASAARGCFLQLAKICAKRGMVVCASGASPRIDWMLRSHDVAYTHEEEEEVIDRLRDAEDYRGGVPADKVILFMTVFEALEFCENLVIQKFRPNPGFGKSTSFIRLDEAGGGCPSFSGEDGTQSLSRVFSHILGLDRKDVAILNEFETSGIAPLHEELTFQEADIIFRKGSAPEAFFVVLHGSVAVIREEPRKKKKKTRIISGAGKVNIRPNGIASSLDKERETGDVQAFLSTGGIFSFVDFILERPRSFRAVSTKDGTVVAKLTKTQFNKVEAENPEVGRIIQNVLLQASVLELANCSNPS